MRKLDAVLEFASTDGVIVFGVVVACLAFLAQ